MLYHVSKINNLKILEPRVSTHGTPYVYAIDNMVTALLFGVKKDDFDFILLTNDIGTPILYECYENAFVEKYKDKACSLYTVDDISFIKGITGWNAEYVSEEYVEVLDEILISDLFKVLSEEETNGNLIIKRYNKTIEYKKIISEHIVDRLIRFNILDRPKIEDRILTRYGKIIDLINEAKSGKHL